MDFTVFRGIPRDLVENLNSILNSIQNSDNTVVSIFGSNISSSTSHSPRQISQLSHPPTSQNSSIAL